MQRALPALTAALLVASRAQAQQPAPSPAPAAEPAPPSGGWLEPEPPPPPPPAPPNGGTPPVPPSPGDRVVVYEPPPPAFTPIFEPPPPPEPRHTSPRSALWLGARLGWFVPFGNVWAAAEPAGGGYVNLRGVPWRDYALAGPTLELDLGARISRNYNVFGLWERAQLGAGRAENDVYGGQTGGDTDYWAVGLRASSDPDRVGFVTEIAIGYRRARAKWQDGTELQFTNAPFEGRISAGVELRLSPIFSFSPMLSVGVGSFGTIRRVSGGVRTDPTGPLDQADGHGWFTLTLGGHFDVAGRP